MNSRKFIDFGETISSAIRIIVCIRIKMLITFILVPVVVVGGRGERGKETGF